MSFARKKILSTFLTLFFVVLLVFFAFRIIPGNPALTILGPDASPQQIALLEQQLGVDKSLTFQFLDWLQGLFVLDFGTSYQYDEPVLSLIGDRIGVTFSLAIVSMIITLIVALPLGIIAANYHRKWIDHLISIGVQFGLAIPTFWSGIILIFVFGLIFKLFSVGNYVPITEDPVQAIKNLFFPALAIAIPQIAIVVRYLKTTLIEQLTLDYVKTAHSKGLSKMRVLFGHVLKNALIPVVTIIGINFGDILAGSLVVEQVFALPGFGRMLITAINNRDFPLVQGMVLIISLIAIVINIIVDFIYRILDPKISLK